MKRRTPAFLSGQPAARTEQLVGTSLKLDARTPLASPQQVEQALGFANHALLAKIEIPSSRFQLGLIGNTCLRAFYLFQNSKDTYAIKPIAESWTAEELEWKKMHPAGTIEIINELDLQNLINHDDLGPGSSLGHIYYPGSSAEFGRDSQIGGSGPGKLGQWASRKHVTAHVEASAVLLTDTSTAGTIVTFAR